MDDKNDIQKPADSFGSVMTKSEDKIVTDGRTTVKPVPPQQIQKRYMNSKLDFPILIAGFSGPGVVGSISANYIIEQLHMRQISYVESEFIMPAVIYIGGNLRHPFRIYANDFGNVCVLVCEIPVMSVGIYSVLNTVVKWAKNVGVKEIMVLEGISVVDQGVILDTDRKAIILSNDADTIDDNRFLRHVDKEDNTRSKLYDGAYVTGISGGLLAACLSNGIACKGLVVPTSANIPDPEGAAILLESVNTLGNESIKIDVDPLRKWATNLKERLQEMNKAILRQQQVQNIDERQQGIYT
jgi:uncharacterized protein